MASVKYGNGTYGNVICRRIFTFNGIDVVMITIYLCNYNQRIDAQCEFGLSWKGKLVFSRSCVSHLGDLWDLGGVDGPAVLGHGHSVPGLFSLHALFSLISLISLISWIYEAKETHRRVKQTGNQTIFIQWWHFWLFLLYMMKYYRSANRREGVGGFLSAVWHNSVSAGYRDRKCACMHAGFLSHCGCVDVSLSLKEDLDCRPDLAVSCCPWRAAAGALFFAPPALQSSPPCGSARWSSGPGRLSWTPSCAERIMRNTSDVIGCQAQRKRLVNFQMIITKRQMCWQICQPFSC